MMQASLTDRVRSGVSLSAMSVALTHATGLARSVVLARLLTPDDYGLFGMALTVTGALAVLTSFRLDFALVTRNFTDESELKSHLDTIWTAGLIRQVFLALLLLAAAYPTARFYGNAELFPVLLLLAAAPVIQGFGNVGLLLRYKRVDFRRLIWLEQINDIISTLAVVALAALTRNVWALALSQVVSAAAGVALSYLFDSYRPRLAFDRLVFRQSFEFGKYMFIVGVTAYVTTTADNIIVGKALGASALGIYVLAYTLASIPINVVAKVIGGVLFPAYFEAGAQNRERTDGAFERAFAVSSALLTVVSALLALLADEMILLLYGAKWAAAAPVLRVLSIICFCRGLMQVVAPFVVSVRGPAPEARAKVVESALFLAILYPLTRAYGLAGAAWAGATVYVVTLIVRLWFVRLFSARAFGRALRILLPSILAGAAGLAAGALALRVVDNLLLRTLAGGLATTTAALTFLMVTQPALRAEAASFAGWLFRPALAGVGRFGSRAD